MESANIFESNEDCKSCESGWTMYLASPSHHHDYYHHHDNNYYDDQDLEEEEASDGGDSMESDASSGPMESLKLSRETQHPISIKTKIKTKSKTKKKMTKKSIEENTTRVHNLVNKNNDDDDDGHGHGHGHGHGYGYDDNGYGNDGYYDDGNDSYSAIYVGSIRQKGLV